MGVYSKMTYKGTGAIKDIKDKRDFKFKDIAKGLEPFDWDKGYDVENTCKIKVKDQNGSSSCGGNAWASYGQVLDPDHDEKSAKFIYANTHVSGGGSAGRTNCDFVIKKGWGSEKLTSSYDNGKPSSEDFMIREEDITDEAYLSALLDKGLSYATVDINIDSVAQAIKENNGCVLGIAGKNNGTWRTAYPKKPDNIYNTWNHWVYAGKAKLINGKKMIGFVNSWGEDVGENGWQWIGEDYIKYPYIWSVWTMVYDFPKFKFTRTLKYGMIGEDVKQLQKRLGVTPMSGWFGPLTKKAVIKYQLSKGLVGDGIVGTLTISKLNI